MGRNAQLRFQSTKCQRCKCLLVYNSDERRRTILFFLITFFSSPTLFKHCSITIIWLKNIKTVSHIVVLHSKRESTIESITRQNDQVTWYYREIWRVIVTLLLLLFKSKPASVVTVFLPKFAYVSLYILKVHIFINFLSHLFSWF